LSSFNENLIFLTDFQQMLRYQISRKSVQWEPSFAMRTQRPAEAIAFHNLANAHKTCLNIAMQTQKCVLSGPLSSYKKYFTLQ
jgi:hypothetical protein